MKQSEEALISVIVPVYNAGHYLRKCLDTIRNQTYPHIEIICVDDHSTDSSGALCDEYAAMDSRIRVIHKKENGGLSEARNTGMWLAKGEYLAFIDSDDWVDRRFLECLYDSMIRYDGDIAQCGYVSITDEAFAVKQSVGKETVSVISGKEALRKLYSVPEEYASVLYTIVCNKLYKKSILSGLRFPKGRMYEDQFFTYRCFDRADRVSVRTEKLYYYRQSSGSLTRSAYHIRFQDSLIAHSRQIRYFKSRDRDFAEIVTARMMPLCILHYEISEYEEDARAKRNAYRYAWKYFIPYLQNEKVGLKHKLKAIVFLLYPDLFIYYGWDIRFFVQ